ncbi:small ubiquitin-related modifier 1-like [Durio zibethinus]|uniref:Small ubiquitin-related modifier 1-like n=1 Tax=Durio zibethinus TaxID=66656 RepID=A0A6P5Y1F7_DURZI|nr:small ubiquitin-related modifier 1-like [Durio zibethinus]
MSQPSGSGGGGRAKSNADGQPETIKVSVKSQDGSTVVYKIVRNLKLSKLMHAYCRKKQLDFRTVRFIHEGHRVPGKYTADKLKLEDGAEICCMFHQMGAGFYFMPKTA